MWGHVPIHHDNRAEEALPATIFTLCHSYMHWVCIGPALSMRMRPHSALQELSFPRTLPCPCLSSGLYMWHVVLTLRSHLFKTYLLSRRGAQPHTGHLRYLELYILGPYTSEQNPNCTLPYLMFFSVYLMCLVVRRTAYSFFCMPLSARLWKFLSDDREQASTQERPEMLWKESKSNSLVWKVNCVPLASHTINSLKIIEIKCDQVGWVNYRIFTTHKPHRRVQAIFL